jgi:uncharacterized protein YjbJ (UPF0337 family)
MEGKLSRLRGELQKRWGRLTNEDLDQIEGQAEMLEGKLQERYGYTKEEASKQVETFVEEARDQFEDVQTRFGRKLRHTGEELQHKVSEAREKVRDKAGQYEEKLKEVEVQDVAQTVKSNPLIMVGVAVLLSVFIGMWVKSMKR